MGGESKANKHGGWYIYGGRMRADQSPNVGDANLQQHWARTSLPDRAIELPDRDAAAPASRRVHRAPLNRRRRLQCASKSSTAAPASGESRSFHRYAFRPPPARSRPKTRSAGVRRAPSFRAAHSVARAPPCARALSFSAANASFHSAHAYLTRHQIHFACQIATGRRRMQATKTNIARACARPRRKPRGSRNSCHVTQERPA